MLSKYLIQILTGVIVLLSSTALWLYISLIISNSERDILKAKLNNIFILSEAAEKKNVDRLKNYDTAIADIVKFYETQNTQVDNFERGSDETDCDAANRLLSGFSY